MGAWGPSLLSNDEAGDLEVFWKDFILPLHEKSPEQWSSQRIAELFANFRPFRAGLGAPAVNEAHEILALGALFLRQKWSIPFDLKRRVVEAATTELDESRLREWTEPGKRRRVLLEFLGSIGERPPEPRKPLGAPPPTSLAEEIAQHKAFLSELPRFLRVMKGYFDYQFTKAYPRYLDRVMQLFATSGDNPQPREWEALKYRLMLTAWVIGGFIGLPDDEIAALISKAEATNGRLPYFTAHE